MQEATYSKRSGEFQNVRHIATAGAVAFEWTFYKHGGPDGVVKIDGVQVGQQSFGGSLAMQKEAALRFVAELADDQAAQEAFKAERIATLEGRIVKAELAKVRAQEALVVLKRELGR